MKSKTNFLREARLDDVEVLAEFNIELARETEGVQLDPKVIRAGVKAVLEDPAKGMYFVVERGGTVVGALMVTYEWSDWRNARFLWIQSVYVAPEFRHQGVFKTLYNHVQQLGSRDGYCGVRLYAHLHNDRAINSYRNLGMRHYDYLVFETADALRGDSPAG